MGLSQRVSSSEHSKVLQIIRIIVIKNERFRCGFDGNGCPIDFFTEYRGLVIGAICAGVLILGLIVAVIVYIVRLRIRETEAKNKLWQVNFGQLVKPEKKNKAFESARSFNSGLSGPSTNSSKFTFDSAKSNQHYCVYVFGGERVIGVNHNITATHLRIEQRDMNEMRTVSLPFFVVLTVINLDEKL